MSWELSIQASEDENGSARVEPGSVYDGNVQSCINSFFPDTHWETETEGICDFDQGQIEFQIHGVPAESIWLRIHNADPAPNLIALARTIGWQVINHSTGADLESEETFRDHQIARIQKKASSYRAALSQTNSGVSKTAKVKLPKIKSQIPLLDVKPQWVLDFLDMVLLRDDEVTLDLFEEYHSELLKNERVLALKGHPTCGTEEVQLPDGQRFAAIMMSRSVAAVNVFYDNFWKETHRPRAKLKAGMVVLANGSQYPAKDCLWVVRAQGRARRS